MALKRLPSVLGTFAAFGCVSNGIVAGGQPYAQQMMPAVNRGDLQHQYDVAFEELLRRPTDLNVLFRFASLASQTGDLEGAVSALEQMLLVQKDLPQVRLELGVLYYRLHSYEVARAHIEVALKFPSLPAEVRARGEQLLSQIMEEQKHDISHFYRPGARNSDFP